MTTNLANTIYSAFGQLGVTVIPVSLSVFLSLPPSFSRLVLLCFSLLDPPPWSSNLTLIGRQVCQQLSHWWSLTAIMLVLKSLTVQQQGREGAKEKKGVTEAGGRGGLIQPTRARRSEAVSLELAACGKVNNSICRPLRGLSPTAADKHRMRMCSRRQLIS